ncbi:adenylate/guanylate cyclase domain-containing protein [Dokdonia sp. LLG6352-1]|jgi:adenylate cyclase|uniref:adenylate/guanylate cyclase domain-containing protein n=1 Tax=Dokdonia sp. LLG6352-1 TaxID=3160831 RepID=UPI00386BECEF
MKIFRKELTNNEIIFYVRRALWILLAWTLISNIIFLYDYATLVSANALTSNFDLEVSFKANLLVSIVAGLFGGIFTVNIMELWLRKYAFWKALIFITILYVVIAMVVGTIGAYYFYSDSLGLAVGSQELLDRVLQFYTEHIFIKNFVIWLFIVLLTLIVLMINDKYGPGVFPDYLMGRYFLPKNETRIFMFADIRDATRIAEKLGEQEYFNFLKDFFNDIAPAIMQTKGEVYQYVGDEVVITWKMKNGVKNANALRCYYRMKNIIYKKSVRYYKRYNALPDFKVGFHYGQVMVGELGKIKRDIAFSGDVLNTTARIQGMCNDKGVDILASKAFADLLKKLPKNTRVVKVGDELLKGKSEQVSLVTFDRDISAK